MTGNSRWERLTELFDRLLVSSRPDEVLVSESDPEIRKAAEELWRHHVSAAEEDFLGSSLNFAVQPAFRAGQILSNRFRIERLLGRGGMGEVYLALDQRMREHVAVKTIARLLSPSASLRDRIVREVQNARRVTHPNVCRIYDLFDDGESVFFTMEYLEGQTLADLIEKPAERSLARSLTRQLAEGLHAAHSIGVVHGDFNPSNIMIAPGSSPRAVIMDFGLACALQREESSVERLLSVRAGTAGYMAPELLQGGIPDIRSDIYAFGKVAMLLLPDWKIWEECTHTEADRRIASLNRVLQLLSPGTTRRYWMVGAICAVAGPAAYEIHSRKPFHLPGGARVLINGFRAAANTSQSARVARGLFMTALAQSPKLRTISDQDLMPALKSMGASLPLAGSTLVTLLTRLRAGYWADAELRSAGSRCSLHLQLFRAMDREAVASISLPDRPGLAAVIQSAALWLRSVGGESEHSLATDAQAVDDYTSRVPEALDKYYEGMEKIAVGNMQDATPLLEEAVRLDPDFAQARSMLGMALSPQLRLAEAYEHVAAAHALAERLPARERNRIEIDYWRITDDPDRMIEAARQNLDYQPDEPRAYRALAWSLARSGLATEAVEYSRKAVEMAPANDLYRAELVTHLVEAGEFDAALGEYDTAIHSGARNPWIFGAGALANLGLGRYPEARALYEKEPVSPSRAFRACDIARVRVLEGDLATAISEIGQLSFGASQPAERFLAGEFLVGLHFLRDRVDLAQKALETMIDLPAYPQYARPIQCAAFWAGRLPNRPALAALRTRAAEISRRWPNRLTNAVALHAEALEGRMNGQSASARDLLLRSLGSTPSVWALFDLADIYVTLGQPEVAIERWREFDGSRGVILSRWFPGILLLGYLHHAMAASSMGDGKAAAQYSRKVLEHWSRTNPNLRIVHLAQNLSQSNF